MNHTPHRLNLAIRIRDRGAAAGIANRVEGDRGMHTSLVILHHNLTRLATATEFTDSSNQNPSHAENGGEYSVSDLEFPGRVGDVQSQATVDDTERDQKTADDEMQVRPELATTVLLELHVMDVTEDRLEEENG